MKKLISITIQLFYSWIVFEIDMLVWFTWLGEIIEIRMLFNINHSCHNFPISQILNSLPHNFPIEYCLREPCVCWHIPIQSNSVVFLRILSLHGSLGLVNLRHAQVFDIYHMPTTKPFLDPWPWLGHPDIHNWDWRRLTIFSTKLVLFLMKAQYMANSSSVVAKDLSWNWKCSEAKLQCITHLFLFCELPARVID